MLAEAEAVLRPVLSTDHRLQARHALAQDFVPPAPSPVSRNSSPHNAEELHLP